MVFIWVVAVLAILIAYYYASKTKYNLPPGPKGLPFVGNLFSVSPSSWETYDAWAKEYGKLCLVKFGNIHVFVMSDTKLIKECFNDSRFQGRSKDMLTVVLSKGMNGIVLSEGSTWVEQRRFTLRHLRDFGFGKNQMETLIMDEVTDLLDGLKKESSGGKAVEMNERFGLAVINSLWMIIAGKKFKQDDSDKLAILQDIDRVFTKLSAAGLLMLMAPWALKMAPEMTGYNECKAVADRLHSMLKEVVEEHEETLPEDGNPRDFIDAYLYEIRKAEEPGSSFYKEEGYKQLFAGIGDLFFAGAETTSTTLSWCVLYLCAFPEVQKKMQGEIHALTGSSRMVTLADKQSLPYTEATILEVLRDSSLVSQGVFHRATERTKFQGYDVPVDSWMVPNQHFIHHDPKVWGDPENFRPERFLSSDGKSVVKNENLIAFSIGKRACIGETLARDEIYLFISNIVQRFEMKFSQDHPKPSMKSSPGFIRRPEEYRVMLLDRMK